MIATSGFLAALECTEFVFDRGSARTSLEKLTALPKPPSSFKRDLLLSGRGGEGSRGNAPPLTQISGSAPELQVTITPICLGRFVDLAAT